MPRYSAEQGSLPSNLFSGGAVALNTSPFTNYYLQTQARDQARNDAIIKFVGDYSNRLTPTGVASEDIDDFMKAKNDWQDFVMQNKSGMANPSSDNGKSYIEAQKRFNNAMAIAQKSKEKSQNILQLKTVLADPTKASLLTDGTLDAIHKASLPVMKGYEPIDYTDVKFNPKPWDAAQESKLVNTLQHFKGNEAFSHYEPAENGMQVAHYKSELPKEQLMGIRQMATNEYHNNPGFKAMIDSRTDVHSTDYPQLNEAFKSNFGTDVHQPEDMATAYMLNLNPNKMSRVGTPSKVPISPERLSEISQQRQINVANAKQGIKDKAAAAKSGTVSTKIRDFTDNIIDEAKKDPNADITTNKADGTKERGFKLKVSDANLKAFSQKDPNGHTITPSYLMSNTDGTIITPKFVTGKESTTGSTPMDATREKPMTRDEFDKVIGKHVFGTKAVNQEQTKPVIPNKKDPLGLF